MKHIKEFNPCKSRMLSEEPYIWPQARIKDSHLGKYTEIADGTSVMHSTIDDFSYAMEHCSIIYTYVGKSVILPQQSGLTPVFIPWNDGTGKRLF